MGDGRFHGFPMLIVVLSLYTRKVSPAKIAVPRQGYLSLNSRWITDQQSSLPRARAQNA